jgi:hypothetical protein
MQWIISCPDLEAARLMAVSALGRNRKKFLAQLEPLGPGVSRAAAFTQVRD